MKVAFDEHIPPPVRDAVKPLSDGLSSKPIEVVAAKDYAKPPASSDVPWLENFAADGGRAVISGDKGMRRRPHEREAITDLGLIVIFLPPSWNNAEFSAKSGYILYWWPVIMKLIRTSNRGTCWELPKGIKVDIEKVKDVTGKKGSK